jgi:hypothetical protein
LKKVPDRISEKFSENRKRGRPMLYPPDKEIAAPFGKTPIDRVYHHTTRRTKMSVVLIYRALLCIESDAGKEDWAKYYIGGIKGDPVFGALHRTILAELGRIKDRKSLLEIAKIVAENKRPTRDSIAYIRRNRLNREDKPDFSRLYNRIVSAIDGYIGEHPETSMDMIAEILRVLLDRCEGKNDGK